MKKSLSLILMLVGLSVMAGTITILWYSQAPHAPTINDNDIMLIERPVPHTNYWISMAQVKSYVNAGITPVLPGPSILTFVNNVNSVEIGTTVNSTVLTWTLGGSVPTSQSINQGIGGVAVGTLTVTDSASYSVARTYTLTVANANGSATANTSVSFLNKRYWGPSAQTALDDNQINALSGELATTYLGFNHSISCNAGGEYMYFAFPTAWGVPKVNVNGLLNTDWTITTTNHVNAAGNTTQYYVYRSNNLRHSSSDIVQLVAP